MKLIMTLLVRDEEDILKENLDYHLSQGVDFIIATDNRSVDSTKKILKKYEDNSLLHYIYEDSDTHDQGKWVTKMSKLAYSEYGADWVINNDADEFWWPINHDNLKEAISSVHEEINIIECIRNNFVCIDKNFDGNPFYYNMYYRERESLNSSGDKLPPKQAHRGINNITVGAGNHKVSGFDNPKILYDLLEIFHFPVRTKEQFLKKISVGGAALERNDNLNKSVGNTWRSLYAKLQKNGNLDEFFCNNIYDDLQLNSKINNGTLLEDKRLMNYLKDLQA